MAKITVTNNNDVAIRFFDGKDVQIDVEPGQTADVEIGSGSAIIDMTPTSEATEKAFRDFVNAGSA